jgi:hypothetical protein
MKQILLYASALIILGITSCDNASTVNESDSKADTAVLVEDPENKLDANPVNDTTVVVDKAHDN